MIEMIIENNGVFYYPILEGKLTWTTDRVGAPSVLKFNVLKDQNIDFQEGNNLIVKLDGNSFFHGYVFTKSRDKKGIISVTAYDQLRYFKNKVTFVYENKTASELFKMLAEDYGLKVGDADDTGFIIASRVEKNKTLFDVMNSAINATLVNTGKLFTLYDDSGKLTLKNMESMRLPILLHDGKAENFNYQSSIDSKTYNKIKLFKENKKKGVTEVFIAKDSSNINRWGVLQKYESVKKGENGQEKADKLLELHNKKTRQLSIKGAFGDIRVRAGSIIGVSLELGDINSNSYMLVEKCTHTIEKDDHRMNLILKGGDIDV